MKIGKKGFGFLLGLTLMMSVGMFNVMSGRAAAWDTYYTIKYVGDGGDVYSNWRLKEDATSFYVLPRGNVTSLVNLRDSTGRNCSYQPYYFMQQLGVPYFLYNDAFEHNGYSPIYVRLQLSPTVHTPTTLWGDWSPDSV